MSKLMKIFSEYSLALAAVLALSCGSAWAQDINPSVEVTNDFASSVSDYDKVGIALSVPDSLRSFNLNFDYDVFSRPYAGAYEFTPYSIMFVPQTVRETRPAFLLNAGAGYTFHPVLNAVLSPRLGDKFALTVYQDFSGYMGPYRSFDRSLKRNGCWQGRDLSETVGLTGSLKLSSVEFGLNLNYDGLYVQDRFLTGRPYHDFGVKLGGHSIAGGKGAFAFDFVAGYNAVREYNAIKPLVEDCVSLDGNMSFDIARKKSVFEMALAADYVSHGSLLAGSMYNVNVTPRYASSYRKLKYSIGAQVSVGSNMKTKHFWMYPDLRADFNLFDFLNIFAGAKGGDSYNSYASLKERDHHFYFNPEEYSKLGFSRSRYDVYVGLGGNIASRLQYDFRVGRAALSDSPMDAFSSLGDYAVVNFADYKLTYADLSLVWKSRSVEAHAGLHYRSTDIISDGAMFDLPAFSMDANVLYNLRNRIFVGLSVEAVQSRKLVGGEETLAIPGWCNLGLYGEYRLNKTAALWLRGGNLLNADVQRVPFIAEDGLNFTVGICMNFR